ncbi:pilus (MSHA type) biogenesis protein MshL [Glaciecola petra]|uniref:Pilus (MSHA type) biogenesis protein MshL n=1 Tax=Glaciecola petra TaxID=3075602 RepID=A0ABU2ZTC2_9ALTE|nr:pilus (MSHA type) biogenesis protein MshL [Aestuariibacter sp. P117]MDT0595656.1 pilus (MSHA type) biogenesis protein MshL [Aestuariibacter sp. P117]
MITNKIHKGIMLASAVLVLFSCSSTDTNKSHVEDYLANEINTQLKDSESAPLAQLPDSVSNTLLEDLNTASPNSLFEAEKYDISATSVAAKSFFASLVQDTPYSVAIHPEVKGQITIDLKQVSLEEVFSLITDIYGFHIEQIGMVFRVFPAGLRTETFSVNYLMMQRDGNTQTSIISGGVSQAAGGNGNGNGGAQGQNNFSGNAANGNNFSGGGINGAVNGTSITTRSEANFWDNLETSLMTMIGNMEGRSVMISPQAGLVSVRAMPNELKTIRQFLKSSEESLTRQVIIEARILEVVLNDEFQQGINWNKIASNIGSTDLTFTSSGAVLGNTISSALGGIANLSFSNSDFSGVLNLLSTQGNVQVLSSPRVTAINNQKAVIKVGDDEYFVTDISSQNTITPTATSVVPDIELTPFFSGIALDVTPQIDSNGSILLHVHPSVIETEEQEKVVTLNQEQIVLPLAQSTIRESDTIIRANSGEIVVIGGLMQSVKTQETSQTPFLGDIPFVGNMFKNRRDKEVKKELIILLKPTVVGPDTWREQLENSRTQMADWLYVE